MEMEERYLETGRTENIINASGTKGPKCYQVSNR
jgi:hypothetical protein